MNLQTEYVEEHAANAGTLDLLEVETSERIRLERELNELRVCKFLLVSFFIIRSFNINVLIAKISR